MRFLLFLAFFSIPFLVFSQDTINTTEYDFWVGNWEATWDEGGGKKGRGTNLIEYTLDGSVLQENFRITEGQSKGFKGTSVSVYNPARKTWKQAWADNQGGYFDFTGGKDDAGNPIFITTPKENGDKVLVSRMVFKNITKEAFLWDWEGSQDGGKTWNLNWRINYKLIRYGNKQMEGKTGLFGQANLSAPEQIHDFDPMIGTCDCNSRRIASDGSWQDPVKLQWTFKYVMNGMGIQDEFSMENGQEGGSLRQYNVDSSAWYVHYYSSTVASPRLQSWKGEKTNDNEIVLYSPSSGQGGVKGFLKLTFHSMSESGYQWKGEWVNEDESVISPFWKIDCRRS